MRENLLKKQPTWGLRRAQGTGQKSATPATLTKVLLVLLTMLLLPSTAWAQTITVAGISPDTDGNFTDLSGVTFNASTSTLTLNNAMITGQIISSYDALKVHLVEESTITPGDGNAAFVYSGAGTATLTFTTNENPVRSSLTLKGITSTDNIASGYTVSNTFETRTQNTIGVGVEAEDGWKVKIYNNDPNSDNKTVIWYFKNYNLFIGGSRVTSDNLTGAGYVNYNPETHTIPITEKTYYPVTSGLEELIIEVSNGSAISASSEEQYAISFETMTGGPASGTLKFVKAADADLASITLTANGSNNGVPYKAIEGFSADNIILGDGLYLTSHATMAEALTATTVTIANSFDISIGETTVTDLNKDNILGDGKVSYDAENHKLTLNNANLTSLIHWGINADLTIELKGTNSMNTSGACIDSEHDEIEIKFTGGDENCSLELSTVTDDYFFSGFSNTDNPSMGTGMYWILTWNNDHSQITSALITNSILGGGKGTEGEPFIISTFEHLKTFAKYVNDGILSTEYIKLGASIECPTNETGFEPIGNSNSFIGTFNGDGNSITGLIFSNTDQDGVAGLFGNIGKFNNGEITRGTVKNLTLSGCKFGNGARNGAIAGNLAYGTIENCTVTSCTISSGNSQSTFSGGITGIIEGNGIVKDCSVNGGTITSSTSDTSDGEVCAGGIVAEASGSSEINGCTVTDVSINSTCNRGHNSYSGGIVGSSQATISGNSVEGTTTVNSINNENNETYAGAIVANKTGGLLTENYYDFTVKTKTTIGNNDPVEKSDYTQRGIGQDIGQENGSYDIPNQVMMAGTKKVNISVTGLIGDRTLSLGEMEDTYCLDERDASTGQLTALYALPRSTISLDASSEEGYKPTFTLSNSDVIVTPTENKEDNFWEIKYEFSMPEDDVTATIAFAKDLASQLYTLETYQESYQESYTYTGEDIEPRISLTISTDPQSPVLLTKGTDYEILKYMKDVDGVFTPIFEEDGTTPKTPVDVGSYQVYISGIGSYTGEAVLEFSITKATTDECIWFYHLVDGKEETVQDVEDATYGTAYDAPKLKNPLNLAVTLSCNAENGSNSPASDVATIDDEGNITILKAGTVYVYAVTEGNENYEAGEVHYQLDIEKGSLENVTITEIDDQVYTGTAIEPELTVTTPDGTSVTTDDYSITYSDNINAGEATITLTAKEASEKFEGSTTTTFNILQADLSKVVLNLTDLAYNGTDQKGSVSVTEVWAGENTDLEVGNEWYTVKYPETAKEVGTYEVTVTANDATGNNFKGTATATFNIVNRTVTSEELGLSDSQPSGTYYSETEDLQVPEGIVAYIITGINGNSLTTQRISYIPKGVAVLTEKGQSSESANDAIPYPSTLPLKGTLEPVDVTSITGGTVYVLYNGEFVKSTSGTIPSHRCYLLVATNVASGTRSFSIDHGDGTTALREVRSEGVKGEKLADGEWYTLQGRKFTTKPTKPGLYILNGKKIVVK